MGPEQYVMGLFRNAPAVTTAVAALEKTPWRLERVHGPIPSHQILDALKLKKSRVGYFTLIGGIIGFFFGFSLAIYTATQWHIIVSGKPVISLIPFFIVGFEFTILFSVFGNVIGLLTQTRLPNFKDLKRYDPRCSGEQFGILASCSDGEREALVRFFEDNGATVEILDAPAQKRS